jgi:hypothetical protein
MPSGVPARLLSWTRGSVRRPQLTLEAVELVEQSDALPRPVSASGGGLTKYAGILESTDCEPSTLLGAAEQLRRGLRVDDRLRRQELDQPQGTRPFARTSGHLDPATLQLCDTCRKFAGSGGGTKQRIHEDRVPVPLVPRSASWSARRHSGRPPPDAQRSARSIRHPPGRSPTTRAGRSPRTAASGCLLGVEHLPAEALSLNPPISPASPPRIPSPGTNSLHPGSTTTWVSGNRPRLGLRSGESHRYRWIQAKPGSRRAEAGRGVRLVRAWRGSDGCRR